MSTIFLGDCDAGKIPNDTMNYLKPFHNVGLLKGTRSFRDDDRSKWRRFRHNDGNKVTELQEFLFHSGFMPRGTIDGVFDYVTQASARLFQEYVRTIEGVKKMKPDGIIGRGTWAHIDRWRANGIVSDYLNSANNPTNEYLEWMSFLRNGNQAYKNSGLALVSKVEAFNGTSDTLKINDWNFDPDEIHLIGIRRNQDISQSPRSNDDLFVLLINGLVFKFWGSTDPNQSMTSNRHEAFLVEGQHKYRFGWHKITNEAKVYRALRPYNRGVLVFRDRDDNNALTETDINVGVDAQPNPTINIHWSGIGSTNWSAGCQVIASKSYINHLGNVVDCSGFAARRYGDLSDVIKKTKGAYNVICDLMISFAKMNVNHIYFTLGRESILNLDGHFGPNYARETLDAMK